MHKHLLRFTAFLMLLVPVITFGQDFSYRNQEYHGGCGTEVTQEHLERMEAWKKSGHPVSQPRLKSVETLLYPIQHWIVTKDDGTGGISPDDIKFAMDHNNEFFKTGNIQFYDCGPYQEIASSEWYDFVSAEEDAMTSGNKTDGVINMYWVGTISNGSVCGYAYFPGGPDVILMANPCYAGVTLEHELGHFFNLYHTHGKSSGTGFTDELVDGSNCATAGDDVCDTPADPDLTGRVNFSDCTYAPNDDPRDANGQRFDPDPSNIMAYTFDKCQTRFTDGQWDRVAAATEHPSRTKYECTSAPCVLQSFDVTDESSYQAYDGAVDVTLLGSTGPYTMKWTGPNGFTASTEDISGVTAGRYYFELTDVTGCSQIDSVDIDFLGCSPDEVRALVRVTPGLSYADEISWDIKDSFGQIVALGSGYKDGKERVDTICLKENETFVFTAYDSYGDGWGGTYEVLCGGVTVLVNNNGNNPDNGVNTNTLDIESQESFVNSKCSAIDLAVNTIISPNTTCNLTDKEEVRITVTNYGSMPITNFDLSIGVNGVTPTTEAVVRTLKSYESFDYTFTNKVDLSAVQVHSLVADVDAIGDRHVANDAATKLVEKQPIVIDNFPYNNDFETGIGELIQSTEDDMDWMPNSGSTPSNLTGPTTDHTTALGSGTGIYYYLEGGEFGLEMKNKTAILESPCIDMSFVSGPFFSFWYHMYGANQGTLRFEVNIGSQGWFPVWSNTGDKGNSWQFVELDMNDFIGLSIKFRFVGTTGNGHLSDMAIDDIQFRNETIPLGANIVSAGDVTCKGFADGFARVNAYGGTPPYTYQWSSGGTAALEENLGPGEYTVTITDFAGITLEVPAVTISEPTELFLSRLEVVDVLCNGNRTGEICVLGTGGTSPYTYSLNGGNYVKNGCFTNLSAGVYYVNVLDKNKCLKSDTIEIIEPPVFELQLDSNQLIACFGDSTGLASVFATGGTPPYSYSWSNGVTDTVVENLVAGVNFVIVEDSNGCQASITFETVQSPRLIIKQSTTTNVSCPGGSDGIAEVTVLGGTAPYNIEWINTGTTGTVDTDLEAGIYTVAVTDALGCQSLTDVVITEPVPMLVTKNAIQTTCFSCNNGEASVAVTGGKAPYTYSWSNGKTDSLIIGLTSGTYYIDITDAKGCVISDSVVVSAPEKLRVVTVLVNDVACYGESDGSILVEGLGGVPPYTYKWGGGQTGPELTGLPKGVYGVTVTDNNGNEANTIVTIVEADELIVDVEVRFDTITARNIERVIVVRVSGGTYPYDYFWDNNAWNGDSVRSKVEAGKYNLIVMDANFCFYSTMVEVPEVGVGELSSKEQVISVFPNPTNGILKIRFDETTAGELSIQNLLGEDVYKEQVVVMAGQVIEVDLGDYPDGVYHVQLFNEQKRMSAKVVKH